MVHQLLRTDRVLESQVLSPSIPWTIPAPVAARRYDPTGMHVAGLVAGSDRYLLSRSTSCSC